MCAYMQKETMSNDIMCVIVLLACAGLIYATCSPLQRRASPTCPLRGGLCQHKPLNLSEYITMPIAIPLYYHLGVYEMDIWLGGQPLRAVFDTGSERLIVASAQCVSNKTCNQDSGVYHAPPGTQKRSESVISYGTQQDRVQWFNENLHVPHVGERPCHMLHIPPDMHRQKAEDNKQALRCELDVGAVYHRSGESNLNVFGFSQPYPGEKYTEQSVLHAIFGSTPPHFSISILGAHGWVVLHPSSTAAPPPCFRVQSFPLVRSLPRYKYYMVEVARVCAVDPGTDQRVVCAHAPRYMIIDTGSNMMSVSSPLLKELQTHGVRVPSGAHIDIDIVTDDGTPAPLRFTAKDYCIGTQLLIRDNLPVPREEEEQFLLLGSLFLRQRYTEINTRTQTVKIGSLLPSGDNTDIYTDTNTTMALSVRHGTRIPQDTTQKKVVGRK